MSWKDILKAKKPDFLDLDGDGNKKEPMSEAAKDVEKQTGKGLESIAHDEQDLKYLMSLNPQKLKQVLEARKRVSRNVPSDAGQRPRIPQFKKILKISMDEARRLGDKYAPEDMKEPVEDEIDREQVIAEVQGWINKYDWSPWNRDNKLLPPRIYFGKNNRGGAILKDGKRIYYTFGRNQLTLGELTGTKDLKISPSVKMAIGTAEETLRKLHSALKGDNVI